MTGRSELHSNGRTVHSFPPSIVVVKLSELPPEKPPTKEDRELDKKLAKMIGFDC